MPASSDDADPPVYSLAPGMQAAWPETGLAAQHLYDVHNDRSPKVVVSIQRMKEMGLD